MPEVQQTFAEFCDAYADYMCEWMIGCSGTADCESADPVLAIRDACETLPQAIADGDLIFEADLAGCLPASLVCYENPEDISEIGPCRGVVHAYSTIGDACYRTLGGFDQPCAEGYCEMNHQCPGICTPYTPDDSACDGECEPGSACLDDVCTKLPAVGESCEEHCLYDFPCVEGDDGKACAALHASGDACDESHPCSSAFGCVDGRCAKLEHGDRCVSYSQCLDSMECSWDYEGGTRGNVCQPVPGPGDHCDFSCPENYGCIDPDFVDDGSYCLALSDVGEACYEIGCRDDLWCSYAERSSGECLPQGGPGDFCYDADDSTPPCLTSPTLYVCIEEECALPGTIGEPCAPNDWQSCSEGWCSTEARLCVEPAREGEPCNTEFSDVDACVEGLYCACEDADCVNTLADSGECRPKKANDAPCETSIECLSDFCTFDGEIGRCVDASACDAPHAPVPEE